MLQELLDSEARRGGPVTVLCDESDRDISGGEYVLRSTARPVVIAVSASGNLPGDLHDEGFGRRALRYVVSRPAELIAQGHADHLEAEHMRENGVASLMVSGCHARVGLVRARCSSFRTRPLRARDEAVLAVDVDVAEPNEPERSTFLCEYFERIFTAVDVPAEWHTRALTRHAPRHNLLGDPTTLIGVISDLAFIGPRIKTRAVRLDRPRELHLYPPSPPDRKPAAPSNARSQSGALETLSTGDPAAFRRTWGPLASERAVRALLARRRLELVDGTYRLLDARPVDAGERESVPRKPRTKRPKSRTRVDGAERASGRPTYSQVGRESVEKLIELGRENATLRASLRTAREEAREAREAKDDAERRSGALTSRVRDLEARAEMAESNLRTLLAAAKGTGGDAPVGQNEMEAILGVAKGGEDGAG
jgi:hypothetical protein